MSNASKRTGTYKTDRQKVQALARCGLTRAVIGKTKPL